MKKTFRIIGVVISILVLINFGLITYYSVIGEILELSKERNSYTGENIYIMNLECNDVEFTLGINEKHLLGEPMVGRRFKGQIWLQGNVRFTD